jgi:ribosomal protein L20
MARVKRGVTAHARHKKVLGLAKGYRGRASTAYRIATGATGSATSAACGSSASTPASASTG